VDRRLVSSAGSDFKHDFGVSFTAEQLVNRTAVYNYATSDPGIEDREGVSAFYHDDSGVFDTYTAYARGIDMLNGAYHFLDLAPEGATNPATTARSTEVRRHDEY
jgi:predicted dithiol-disulfide oxidoreductase (DUF899 family)